MGKLRIFFKATELISGSKACNLQPPFSPINMDNWTLPRKVQQPEQPMIHPSTHFLNFMLNRVWPFVTLWTAAHQAPVSLGLSLQEYWSELPFPSPGDLSDPGMEFASPAFAGGFFTTEPPGKPFKFYTLLKLFPMEKHKHI